MIVKRHVKLDFGGEGAGRAQRGKLKAEGEMSNAMQLQDVLAKIRS